VDLKRYREKRTIDTPRNNRDEEWSMPAQMKSVRLQNQFGNSENRRNKSETQNRNRTFLACKFYKLYKFR
jgi:hypothetical protein